MNDGLLAIGKSWVMYGILLCRFLGHLRIPFLFFSHIDGLFMNHFFFLVLSFTYYFLFFLFDHQRHFTSPGFTHRSSHLFAGTVDYLQICLFRVA
ncbi:hypothetical protein HDV63DRAFT_45920 [Trichoderma sp. SZMC 28014]